MKIAIIPARGGSKRIPRKNIKLFFGKPVIAYSIAAAIESGCFDEVIVSTDDDEIAEIARQFGAKVPFMRNVNISDDITPLKDVMRDVIGWYQNSGQSVSHICCVYATAPLIRAIDIKMGFKALESKADANFSISVTPFSYPIQRALKIKNDGLLGMDHPEHNLTRSQDLELMYHDAAQFFWAHTSAMMKYDTIFDSSCCPIIIPSYRIQDMDTKDDWIEAELKYQIIQAMKGRTSEK